ncbi:hypothetical protein Agub_g1407, partial [Astrephomene gubernaculifera]
LREHISRHQAHIRPSAPLFDVDAALSSWTLDELEEQGGLAASLGFTSRQQYHEAACSLPLLPDIRTPTLVLLAEDDPFLGAQPTSQCAANPSTLLALTRRG